MANPKGAQVRAKAESGDPNAMLELVNDWILNDNPEGFVWLERATAAGVPGAFSSLGWAYERGQYGLTPDLAKAVESYQRAVAAGVKTLGPLDLPAHTKKLAAKLKRQQRSDHDPLAELFTSAKLEKHKARILAAQLPSIRWVATPLAEDDVPLGGSKVGGSPDLPSDHPWPTGAGRALEHVATLDFDEAPPVAGVPAVRGKLVFFYDAKNMAFGDEANGDGAFAVVHVTAKELTRAKAPDGTKTLKPSRLAPRIEQTLPAVSAHAYASLELPAKAIDKYRDLLEAWPRVDKSIEYHRSFGHGEVTDESGAPEAVLLLQLDSYEHGGINWGDAGRLFFWIEREDLAAGRFDRVSLQLQG